MIGGMAKCEVCDGPVSQCSCTSGSIAREEEIRRLQRKSRVLGGALRRIIKEMKKAPCPAMNGLLCREDPDPQWSPDEWCYYCHTIYLAEQALTKAKG